MGAHFRLKDGNYLGHCLTLGRVTLPASLNHLPHTIRELRVIRSIWPMSLQHQMDPCNLALVTEWNPSGKNLRMIQLRLGFRLKEFACALLTSQATIPNA